MWPVSRRCGPKILDVTLKRKWISWPVSYFRSRVVFFFFWLKSWVWGVFGSAFLNGHAACDSPTGRKVRNHHEVFLVKEKNNLGKILFFDNMTLHHYSQEPFINHYRWLPGASLTDSFLLMKVKGQAFHFHRWNQITVTWSHYQYSESLF